MATLIATEIEKTFLSGDQDLSILRGASLELSSGANAAILGPSGSGKSTFLHILGGLESPTRGTVTLDGVNPHTLPPKELARFRNQKIGFIFQEHFLLPQLSALENVLVPALAAGPVGSEIVKHGIELLAAVGLSSRSQHRPAQLSGGERQRVAVARSLIMNPTVILADEPTGSLDSDSARSIGRVLCDLQVERNVILVCVTHSQALADEFQQQWSLTNGCLTRSTIATPPSPN